MPSITPRQIVARNLRELRHRRGWTGEEAGKQVALALGTTWAEPKVMFSAMERSADSANKRARAFDVEDLVGIARAFEVSPLRLLMPPDDATEIRVSPNPKEVAMTPGELLDLLFIDGWAEIDDRLDSLPPSHRGAALERQTEILDGYTRGYLQDLSEIREKLEAIQIWSGDLQYRFGDARERVRKRLAEQRLELRATQPEHPVDGELTWDQMEERIPEKPPPDHEEIERQIEQHRKAADRLEQTLTSARKGKKQ